MMSNTNQCAKNVITFTKIKSWFSMYISTCTFIIAWNVWKITLSGLLLRSCFVNHALNSVIHWYVVFDRHLKTVAKLLLRPRWPSTASASLWPAVTSSPWKRVSLYCQVTVCTEQGNEDDNIIMTSCDFSNTLFWALSCRTDPCVWVGFMLLTWTVFLLQCVLIWSVVPRRRIWRWRDLWGCPLRWASGLTHLLFQTCVTVKHKMFSELVT